MEAGNAQWTKVGRSARSESCENKNVWGKTWRQRGDCVLGGDEVEMEATAGLQRLERAHLADFG